MPNLKKRARMIRAIRRFFESQGYLEVETPSRIPVPVPEEHIDLFRSDGWYLQSSPELCMKRLMARGHEKIFQICKCFRKDERGDRHLTELTMLEWYRKGFSYQELMDECRDMIRYVAAELGDFPSIQYGDHDIDIHASWRKLPVTEVFHQLGSMEMRKAEATGKFDEIMAFEIEPHLGWDTPTFIYDYPASMASLAKLKADDNRFAERFELYIAGIELANGFSELTDPIEQKMRFVSVIENQCSTTSTDEKERREEGNTATSEKAMQLPEKFLEDLSKMPTTAGIALGIDRLAMIFTNSPTIDRVVAFTPEAL